VNLAAAHDLTHALHDTRAFGRTIEIDLFGAKAKICSFDCPYCDLGATEVRLNKLKEAGFVPSAAEILENAQKHFREIHEKGPGVDSIVISGNGEPTLHPEFPEIVAGLMALRDVWLAEKPIALLTNGCHLDQRRVNEAVNKLDQRVVKVDVGNERLFKALNAPLSRVTLQKVIGGIRLLKDVTIRAMFVQGAVDNTQANDVEDWIEVVGLLKPKAVHITGLSRPAHTLGLRRCDEDTLHTIATKLERRTGLKALILP
jgi:wyosine [tRNA(Phe)-imidazoG37] synthetase (radical SAM superfamily)